LLLKRVVRTKLDVYVFICMCMVRYIILYVLMSYNCYIVYASCED
jgi:hypothetical protein